MATYYSDESAILVELKKYGPDGSNALNDELMDRVRTRADQMVNRKLINVSIPETIPDEIQEAATLYAIARALDVFFAEQDNRSPTARQNDLDADAILDGYMDEHPEEESGMTITVFGVNGDTNKPKKEIPNWEV